MRISEKTFKLFAFTALASNSLLSQVTNPPINIKSPEASSYEKRGNIPVNKFAGMADISIPIFTQSIGGYNIDLNLQYDSSGFLPTKKSGYYGLNWSINPGGLITREVIGDSDDYYFYGSSQINGFLQAIKLNKTNEEVFAANYNLDNYPVLTSSGLRAEIESDKYSFNFFGVSGYFYLTNNGLPIVYCNDPNIVVDISDYQQQPVEDLTDCRPLFSGFKIFDGNGNVFLFGGQMNSLEISSNLGQEPVGGIVSGNGAPNMTITSWYLREVVFKDGKRISYTYNDDFGVGEEMNYCKRKNMLPYPANMNVSAFSFDINKYVNQINTSSENSFEGSINGSHVTGSGQSSTWQSPYLSYNVTKKVKLQKINFIDKEVSPGVFDNNYTIEFEYLNTLNDSYRYDYLEKILIKNRYKTVKTVDFSLSPKGSASKRWLLTKLKLNQDEYNFEYYNDGFFPPETTRAVDFWGYWNGKPENNPIIPAYTFSKITGDLTITGDSRNSNPAYSDVGILKKVIYPTKGTTEFIYEPHDFSYKIARNSTTDFLPQVVGSTGTTSGLRIKRMIDTPNYGSPIIREFKYLQNRNNSTAGSSGILKSNYDFFTYTQYTQNFPAAQQNIKRIVEQGSNIEQSIFSKQNMEYSKVQEYLNGSLYKEYIFTSSLWFPDYADNLLVNTKFFLSNYSNIVLENYQKNSKVFFIDNSDKRGKLREEVFFKDNNEIRRITTDYKTLPFHPYCKNIIKGNNVTNNCNFNTDKDYTTKVNLIKGIWVQKSRVRTMPFVVDVVSDENYLSNGNFVQNTIYNYLDNKSLSVSQIQKAELSGEVIYKTSYSYPSLPGDSKLVLKNMVSTPLKVTNELEKWTSSGFVSKETSKTLTEYDNDPANFNPKSISTYDLLTGVATAEIVYDKYDSKGNIQQYTTRNGVSTTIIWGYNKSQPIAKIEGAKLSDISQSLIDNIVNASDNDGQLGTDASEQSMVTVLDAFRNSSALSGFQISTYTYNPLIGVTSITPPSGIREFYIYDTANRLKEVRENSATGKIIKEYQYNYKN
ncbi:hypothetical protein [Chryseobacterium sp. OSA05B]|uniref:hypothetical protein n=1 Tax=Chryseobacterium sp. OSA05B TaxID=2862650 RepID=UPI001CBF3FF7|nr:hypothetical protein [Chryseobacterium sp. OSA05B]